MLSDDEFRRLLAYLDRPWAGFRKVRKGVKKRVRRHMQSLGCITVDSYIDRIHGDQYSKEVCEQHLLVTISRFFRDHALWTHLQNQILPGLMDRFPGGLAAWSAGCANGEEPYTLAMLWAERFAGVSFSPALRILATDADSGCIQRAETGRYPPSSLKEVPGPYKIRWFAKAPGKHEWQVDPSLKNLITWQHHQLLDPPPPGPFQIILLRNNLLTYHQGPEMLTALTHIIKTLSAGGVLILGSHERLPPSPRPLKRDAACPWIYRALDQK